MRKAEKYHIYFAGIMDIDVIPLFITNRRKRGQYINGHLKSFKKSFTRRRNVLRA